MPKRKPKAGYTKPAAAKLGLQGDRVRQRREELRMTQTELAYHTGGQPSNISTIESGRRDAQSYKVAALAMILAVSSDWLLGLTDDKTPHGRT